MAYENLTVTLDRLSEVKSVLSLCFSDGVNGDPIQTKIHLRHQVECQLKQVVSPLQLQPVLETGVSRMEDHRFPVSAF
ncbi:hypothetical protein HanPI659440_Chr10g0363981 [Helianthus annuus]|nr:hypothetical protein HanPI659440_Chr10g0363981 [Helianthus annuus]